MANDNININFDALMTNTKTILPLAEDATVVEEKKKRGRPRKEAAAPPIEISSARPLSMVESNAPYIDTYSETQNQLKATVMGIDALASQIDQDLRAVRASRTLKNKYNYICELTSAAGSLVGNRISAIREINNTITNAHRLDIARIKETKSMMANEQDEDKAIMDMYRAYVNTPIGSVPNMPNTINPPASVLNGNEGVPIITPTTVMTEDTGYNKFLNTPSPELMAITFEQNPNLQTVVVYNQTDQSKWFDVIDTNTGQSLPGIPRPDPELLKAMQPDIVNGIAKNLQTNQTYPLVITGNRKLDEY